MKTDHQLKQDVIAELSWDPSIKADQVGVAVKDGIVTLTGHIETFLEKDAIEKALRRVSGVKAIALELDVKLSALHRRNDTELAGAIEHTLEWHTAVPNERLMVTVDNGWVTLRGELEWDYQRRSAEIAVPALVGVRGVTNEITIKPRATPAGVLSQIEEALKRQAEREAHRIQVEVRDGTVTLRGHVRDWHERDAAAGAAWSAPGVRTVVNDIRIEH